MRTIVVAAFLAGVLRVGLGPGPQARVHRGQGFASTRPRCRCGPSSPNGRGWAGTKVVGAERIAGSPLTIHLENLPEAQALEIVLRNVAGYMAAPRQAASLGASAYDRILVMPTSSAPQATAAAGNRGARSARPAPTPPTRTRARAIRWRRRIRMRTADVGRQRQRRTNPIPA